MLYAINILLQKLKTCFQPYAILWHKWRILECNGLNATDVYTLTIFQRKNFEIAVDDLLMFYFKKEMIDEITVKLQQTLPVYKLWLVKQWQYSLCSLALSQNFDAFFSTKIDRLDLPHELKVVLKEFNCRTLADVMKKYTEDELCTDVHFDKLQRFLVLINRRELRNSNHKKGGNGKQTTKSHKYRRADNYLP